MNINQNRQLLIVENIKQALAKARIEQPYLSNRFNENCQQQIEKSLQDIFISLGIDINNHAISKTPKRIAKMWINELFMGLDYNNFPEITLVDNYVQLNNLVIIDNIPFYSTCEHHLQTMQGKCFIAYVPNQTVLGLSKFNRVVDFFARRPQLQERLTKQIQVAMQSILETQDVAVITSATHNCIKCRGVQSEFSATSCYAMPSTGTLSSDSPHANSKIFHDKVNHALSRYPLI